jgi:hypothetical protein
MKAKPSRHPLTQQPPFTSLPSLQKLMGEINHGEKDEDEDVELDSTEPPPQTQIGAILLDRRWVFDEVLWIRGSSTHLSRQELIEAVADAKGVEEDRVDCCFFDEDELSHSTVPIEKMGAAGQSKGDVVCIWKTKYDPAPHRKYSRNWNKIKKKQDKIPARWYMITAIRKDGLLDDVRMAETLSAEYVDPNKVAEIERTPEETEEMTMWLPPKFDERNKPKTLYDSNGKRKT